MVLDDTNSFKHLGIWDGLPTLADSGYTKPTPFSLLRYLLCWPGVMWLGQSNTGSGKTAAFALPLLQRVDVDLKKTHKYWCYPNAGIGHAGCSFVRKLWQVSTRLDVAAVYGGSGYSDQIQQLRRGAQIVVGTPGRVMDHMREGRMDLSSCHAFVLDERTKCFAWVR